MKKNLQEKLNYISQIMIFLELEESNIHNRWYNDTFDKLYDMSTLSLKVLLNLHNQKS